MPNHIDNYRRAWNIAEDEFVPCEVCGGTAVDIHHITYRSHGRDDSLANLIGLCRACHSAAHAAQLDADELRAMKKWPKGKSDD